MLQRNLRFLIAAAVLCLGGAGYLQAADDAKPKEKAKTSDEGKLLFDGKSLEGWESTKFGGEGDVYIEDGAVVLEMGTDMTGITYTGKPLRMNYEITLEAKRLEGFDFFCGLTFPVGEDPCSLIVGGWGGGLVGLSSLDNRDASENETASWHKFQEDKWYPVRLRVTEGKIEAWVDGKQVVDVDTKGRKISIRPEVIPCKPLGVATWRTKAALRNIRVKELPGS